MLPRQSRAVCPVQRVADLVVAVAVLHRRARRRGRFRDLVVFIIHVARGLFNTAERFFDRREGVVEHRLVTQTQTCQEYF